MQERVDSLRQWDFSAVERYLDREGMHPDEIDRAIIGYKQMMLEGLATGIRQQPSELEDRVLHAHLLHTADFARFRQKVLVDFEHEPENDYVPSKAAIDSQLLDYAIHARLTPRELPRDPLYSSGALAEDWGFLVSYLLSDECENFRGDENEARSAVFNYLKASVAGWGPRRMAREPELKTVLEAHIIHTRNFREFRYQFGGKDFDYVP